MTPFFRDVAEPLWSSSGCVVAVADSKNPRQVFVASRYSSWKSLWEAVGPAEFSLLSPHARNLRILCDCTRRICSHQRCAVNALTKNFPNLKNLSVEGLKQLGILQRIAETMANKESVSVVVVDMAEHERRHKSNQSKTSPSPFFTVIASDHVKVAFI